MYDNYAGDDMEYARKHSGSIFPTQNTGKAKGGPVRKVIGKRK